MDNLKLLPLTHPQKRIWYIEKIYSDTSLYNLGGCLNINGKVDFEILEETINIVIQKNEGFRLKLTEKDGQVYQYVSQLEKAKIEFNDFSKYKAPEAEFEKWRQFEFRKKFAIENSLLYYFSIYKINENKWGIFTRIHHIISDGWSISLLQKQICEIYSKLVNGTSVNTDVEFSYVDYIEDENKYLNSNRFLKNKKFWNEKFEYLPKDFSNKTSEKVEGQRKRFILDNTKSIETKKYLKEKGYSLNTFFTSILLIYISKINQQEDIVIGTPVFNRSGKRQKNTIGMFTSTMPFRMCVNEENSITEFMDSVNVELKACFYNQKYPYDLLVQDLELRKKGYNDLFQICVNYYNTKFSNVIDGISVFTEELYSENQNYSLQVIINEWLDNDVIELAFDYKVNDYTEEEINDMYKYFNNIIDQILYNNHIKISDLNLLSEKEEHEILYKFNTTEAEYPKNKTIYELFQEQVERTPDKIALSYEGEELTYAELNSKSNQLAVFLENNGVQRESIVGIMATHSNELVVGILAILKAGGAYLPIDPNYPQDRIDYMLEDSQASILLTNYERAEDIDFKGKVFNLKDENLYLYSSENFEVINTSRDMAYIIYTSGSTGKPKGVMIEHQGLVNYIYWAQKMYVKDEDEVFALYSSISFDLTVTSIFTPLISGSKIAVYYDDGTEFILYKILRENKATVIKLTPSHLTLIKSLDNRNSSVRRFIVGGESLKANLAASVHESFGGNIELLNEYGPTETVVGCMIHKYDFENDKGASVPIGVPADNVQIYILDKQLKVLPAGAVGEIYVSGDGVARGYLNRADLTQERFITNPFVSNSRMYKTGDLARYMRNLKIEYIGRADNQVKIRGHRIELGEIEKYLLDIEYISDAVVIDRENNNGDKYICAYIIGKKEINDLELRNNLIEFLPNYMVPSSFVYLDEFPLTPNGKVNTNLLPESEENKNSNVEFIQYRNNEEEQLTKVMEEILGIENIGMQDNFYQLGGDSIKAIQISSKLNDKGLKIKVKDILSHNAVEEIAACIESSTHSISIDQGATDGTIEDTPIVSWFLSQEFNNINHWNQSVLLTITEEITVDNIQAALEKLIQHHDTLRINYNTQWEKLFYNNENLSMKNGVEVFDLSNYSSEEQNNRIKELGEKLKSSFNIEEGILFKACLFKLGERGNRLLLTAHHLVVDGVSWRIILEDFGKLLIQIRNTKELTLPLKSHSMQKWAVDLKEYCNSDLSSEEEFWNSVLENKFSYPVDYNLGEDLQQYSSTIKRDFSEEETAELFQNANTVYSLEANEVLTIALALTISELSKEENIVIELEGHGREEINNEIDISRTVGWFTSIYPASLKVEEKDLSSQIKDLKEMLRNIPNKGFDFGVLKYLTRTLSDDKQKHIRFNYLGDFDNSLKNDIFQLSDLDSGVNIGNDNNMTALIDIIVMMVNRKLEVSITYSKNKFKEDTMLEFTDVYFTKLQAIINQCSDKEVEFTPSDFEAADISMEDLDSLFE